MDYTMLKQEIKEIAAIADSVPEPFKLKCFEVLLARLISDGTPASDAATGGVAPVATGDLPMNTQLRLLLQRTGLGEDELRRLVIVADSDVHFVKEPSCKYVADGQIQWALLLALKNCILNNALSVDPEDVRSVCQDKGFYDAKNFASNFKRASNARFFKGVMEPQGDARQLSTEGQDELAALVRRMVE